MGIIDFRGGPRDGAINYKHDLYGAPKRNLDGSYQMRRKQVYLTFQQEQAIKRLAHDRGVPEAVIIREAMNVYLREERAPYDEDIDSPDNLMGTEEDPIVQMGSLGGSGVTDGARNYKRDLYGAPGRRP